MTLDLSGTDQAVHVVLDTRTGVTTVRNTHATKTFSVRINGKIVTIAPSSSASA